jgi:hypothetical protein
LKQWKQEARPTNSNIYGTGQKMVIGGNLRAGENQVIDGAVLIGGQAVAKLKTTCFGDHWLHRLP